MVEAHLLRPAVNGGAAVRLGKTHPSLAQTQYTF